MTVYYSAAQKTVLDPVIADSRDPKKQMLQAQILVQHTLLRTN